MSIIPYGVPPYILSSDFLDKNGNRVFEDNSLGSIMLKLFAQKYNITIIFLEPKHDFTFGTFLDLAASIKEGIAEFALGIVPYIDFILTLGDCSVPYNTDHFLLQIPCPQPVSRVKRVISIFTISTWSLLGFVFLSSSVIFWILSTIQNAIGKKETTHFNNLMACFYSGWAILFGVSVPKMPKSSSVRCFFIFYVCYCLAVCVILQVFFTTFLVEPGYGKTFESIEQIINSNIIYGYVAMMDILSQFLGGDLHKAFEFREECPDFLNCTLRVMFKGDMVLANGYKFAYFSALSHGVYDVSKVACFLMDLFTIQLSIFIHKGNPILYKLDKHVRLCTEIGIPEKFWSQTKHSYLLQAIGNYDESEMYFVFTLNHLLPVFLLFIICCFFSFVVLLIECAISKQRRIFRIRN
ncbi:hypothetical protein L9F63_006191 [Diploptera punctata]|uniref:Ionotropic receptor n=1 Tax=Diploptera punctata TaxID=6984 RepID=A0AAD7ZBN3_DIPPU|nr:hypothetical protein L9F63_006191 [Diploptera punctata]